MSEGWHTYHHPPPPPRVQQRLDTNTNPAGWARPGERVTARFGRRVCVRGGGGGQVAAEEAGMWEEEGSWSFIRFDYDPDSKARD